MAAIVKTATVVHLPTGPVWLTAGSPVPKEFAGLVGDHLLSDALEPAPTIETVETVESGGDEENITEEGAVVEPETGDEEPESKSDEDENEDADGEDEGVPYASYPTEKWKAYAETLSLNVDGLKKAQIINAVAAHFKVATDGLKPTEIADAIREAAN